MITRRFIVAAILVAAFIITGTMVYIASSSRQTGHVDAMKILAATRTYTADLKASGLTLPATVSLQELIDRQLLAASDVSGFTGMQVTVTLSADGRDPQAMLIRARLPDGHEVVALADGSIHQ